MKIACTTPCIMQHCIVAKGSQNNAYIVFIEPHKHIECYCEGTTPSDSAFSIYV